jgi:hypothetical protein
MLRLVLKRLNEMEIECVFIKKCQIRRKQHYDENPSQPTQLNLESVEESFKIIISYIL